MVSPVKSPLIDALLAVREWYEAREVLWTHRADQAIQLRELRWRLTEIMVWLELHDGQEEAASRLDAAVEELKEKWWDFDRACEAAASHAEEEPRCREAADVLLAAAGKLAGVLEDLADEIPDSIWQGYGDV